MQLDEDDAFLLNAVTTFFPDSIRKIGLAVSGGSDSMAMLHLFAQLAKDQNYQLSVATVDHGLRADAATEADFVAQVCKALGLKHQLLKWTGWDGKGNLQAQARDARYLLLGEWAKQQTLDRVAIGHTLDDQAETFLARLARGSGLDGLAGMDKVFKRNDVEFARPCLSLERERLRSYLRRHGHDWRDDPSNEDEVFQRVRARKVLKSLGPLGIDAHKISQTAADLSTAKATLRDIAQGTAKNIVSFQDSDIVMDWAEFSAVNGEISRRILGAALQWIGQTNYPPRSDAVQGLQTHVHGRQTRTLNGCLVTTSRDEIRISREFEVVKQITCSTQQVWDGRWRLGGPHHSTLETRALGPVGLPQCPDWRSCELPRSSLLATPSIWLGDELIAAPLAKLNSEWTATLTRGEKQFFSSMVTH